MTAWRRGANDEVDEGGVGMERRGMAPRDMDEGMEGGGDGVERVEDEGEWEGDVCDEEGGEMRMWRRGRGVLSEGEGSVSAGDGRANDGNDMLGLGREGQAKYVGVWW